MKSVPFVAIAASVLALGSFSPAPDLPPDDELIRHAQEAAVSSLDPALPDLPFAEWIDMQLGSERKLEWEVNDCGEQTGDPAVDRERDLPVCAALTATLPRNRTLYISVQVGNAKSGVAETPILRDVMLERNQKQVNLQRLSDLPAALKD